MGLVTSLIGLISTYYYSVSLKKKKKKNSLMNLQYLHLAIDM